METKFKDLAHLYLGCEVYDEEKPENTTAILDCIHTNGDCWYNFYDNNTLLSVEDTVMCGVQDIKPILKHLQDISYEDAIMISSDGLDIDFENKKVNTEDTIVKRLTFSIGDFTYLLSKGYDLFNLIETNQAINAKTLK